MFSYSLLRTRKLGFFRVKDVGVALRIATSFFDIVGVGRIVGFFKAATSVIPTFEEGGMDATDLWVLARRVRLVRLRV